MLEKVETTDTEREGGVLSALTTHVILEKIEATLKVRSVSYKRYAESLKV